MSCVMSTLGWLKQCRAIHFYCNSVIARIHWITMILRCITMGYNKFIAKFITPTPNNLVASIQIRKSFFCHQANPSHRVKLIHASRLIPSFLHLRVKDRGFDSHPRQSSAMFLHAQCRSFFCLLMLSADSYIDVRERLQVNDLFMHMLVDIRANNCKSRSDFLVTSRLWRSMSG